MLICIMRPHQQIVRSLTQRAKGKFPDQMISCGFEKRRSALIVGAAQTSEKRRVDCIERGEKRLNLLFASVVWISQKTFKWVIHLRRVMAPKRADSQRPE